MCRPIRRLVSLNVHRYAADSNPLKAINHAAVLTGWGYDEATEQYHWILRNTYGDHWGEQG
jgi:aminopeptidase C